ncbi:MAG: helix-turn-helix domain-containing protein [Moorella sp. (in: firmicutes)]
MSYHPPLSPEVKQKILSLHNSGLNGYEIATRLGIGKTTAYKHLPKQGRPWHKWTEDELQQVVDGYARGWSPKKIAARIGCSPTAVRIAMCRYRKQIRADPQKRRVLHLLKVGMEAGAKPGQVITAIRRAKILGRGNDVLQL